MIRTCHTISNLDINAGGPSRTVPALCAALSDQGTSTQVFEQRCKAPVSLNPKIKRTISDSRNPFSLAVELTQLIRQNNIQILHDHGQWLPSNAVSAIVSSLTKTPRVVTTRGMLSPWAMNHKRLKKKAAWLTYGKRCLLQASAIHATSELEREELRSLGIKRPIFVIPNGVDLPPDQIKRDQTVEPYLLFLSRIHPKKGLDILFEAWNKINTPDCKLIIAGPDETNLLAGKLPQNTSYIGAIDGVEKWRLITNAKALVLPTYSENFGMVVAEALACRTPVITTSGTPWRELDEHKCGWYTKPATYEIQSAITDLLNKNESELRQMGDRGRLLVARNYSWKAVASKIQSMYEWVLDG